MALNVISNYAANVAHRNLTISDNAATSSLAKLSSGSRVVTAKDDAASMAIGNRMNVEVNALKQANVNAGPAVRSEEHTSELQSLMRISYAVFCLKNKNRD